MNSHVPTAAIFVGVLLGSSGSSQAEDPPETPAAKAASDLHVAASLIAPETSFVPGHATQIGVHLKIRDGWHVYWNGRNDTGTPVRVSLTLPKGFKAGEILWPGPVRHVSAGEILDHVYEREVTLLIPIEISDTASSLVGSPAKVSAHIDWVVCREVCVFESIDTELSLPLASNGAKPSTDLPKFETSRAALPKPWPTEKPPVSISFQGDRVEIASPGANWLAFYPYEDCTAFLDPIRDAEAERGSLEVRFDTKESTDVRRLFGVLAMKPTASASVEYYVVDAKPSQSRSIDP